VYADSDDNLRRAFDLGLTIAACFMDGVDITTPQGVKRLEGRLSDECAESPSESYLKSVVVLGSEVKPLADAGCDVVEQLAYAVDFMDRDGKLTRKLGLHDSDHKNPLVRETMSKFRRFCESELPSDSDDDAEAVDRGVVAAAKKLDGADVFKQEC